MQAGVASEYSRLFVHHLDRRTSQCFLCSEINGYSCRRPHSPKIEGGKSLSLAELHTFRPIYDISTQNRLGHIACMTQSVESTGVFQTRCSCLVHFFAYSVDLLKKE